MQGAVPDWLAEASSEPHQTDHRTRRNPTVCGWPLRGRRVYEAGGCFCPPDERLPGKSLTDRGYLPATVWRMSRLASVTDVYRPGVGGSKMIPWPAPAANVLCAHQRQACGR